jgi:uncharacterized protein YabE (DUF348 family)
MKMNRWLALAIILLLFACQPSAQQSITILDGDKIITMRTDKRIPSAILAEAGISFAPTDRILLNGLPIQPEFPITNYPGTLQLRRAVPVNLSTSQGQQQIQTSALTVGEALQETGIQLHAGDSIDPPLNFPILQSPIPSPRSQITIYQLPLTNLTITSSGRTYKITASARSVGEALAQAGIPLLGGDYSIPAENEALPPDGQIKVVRVSENVLLAQKPIPFTSELIASADVPIDQTQILQPGETGLTMQRIRVDYEDGVEVSRLTEAETVVRPPKNRVLGYGTKIEIKTAVVDGVTIEYWRAVQMYVTSYSPCRSGGDGCYNGTSSGARVQKGVAGMRYDWYLSMGGQQLYIPGYGLATVADVCGGCVGKPWIDVAYSDNDYVPWSSWVTVYFLTPIPSNIMFTLE